MPESVGTTNVGGTTYSQLFKSTNGPQDIISCAVKGNQAQTIPMGAAMIDDGSNPGYKKRYIQGGATTGACILMEKVVTIVGGPDVSADGCRDGSVKTSLIVNSTGGAVDAGFKSALPKVMFD